MKELIENKMNNSPSEIFDIIWNNSNDNDDYRYITINDKYQKFSMTKVKILLTYLVISIPLFAIIWSVKIPYLAYDIGLTLLLLKTYSPAITRRLKGDE